MKARLCLDVEFDGRKTNAENVAAVLEAYATGMDAVPLDSRDEYRCVPKTGNFFVLDTVAALQHATDLDHLIDGQEDELGESLVPVRDFLRQVAGKK